MCGPYIHGRSFWDEVAMKWHHLCEPMEKNAHREFPKSVEVFEHQFVSNRVKCVTCGEECDKERWFYSAGKKEGPFCSHCDAKSPYLLRIPEPMMGSYRFRNVDLFWDWGIQPWDGKWIEQRRSFWNSGTSPTFGLSISSMLVEGEVSKLESLYLPKTRSDLVTWARKHWGQRGDGNEFAKDMMNCIDVDRLWPSLPDYTYVPDMTPTADFNWFADPSGAIPKSIHPLCLVKQQYPQPTADYAGFVMNKNPDRWASMFHAAPNDFWKARG